MLLILIFFISSVLLSFYFPSEFQKYNWEDPLGLRQQLTEDEVNIMDTTRKYCQDSLMPGIIEAYRHESNKKEKIIIISQFCFFGFRIR